LDKRYDLILILSGHALIFGILTLFDAPLGHDTLLNLHLFSEIYSNFLFHGEIPLWLPYMVGGSTSDYVLIGVLLPAYIFVCVIGKIGSITDTLSLFRLAVYLQEMVLLLGLFKLSSYLHFNRLTPVLISTTGVLSVCWAMQIHWNLHLIYLLPLTLYFSIKFLRGNGIEWAGYGLISLTLAGAFYTKIFIVFTLVLLVILFVGFGQLNLIIGQMDLRRLFHFSKPMPLGFLIILISAATAVLNILFGLYALSGSKSVSQGRRIDGTSSLDQFLSYAGHDGAEKFFEFIYGASAIPHISNYIGIFSICFISLALLKVRRKIFWIFVGLSALVLLFSLGGKGGVAELSYWFFPMMDRFRHIAHVLPVLKILLLIASGFGIDYFLKNQSSMRLNSSFFLGFVILIGCIFFYLDFFRGVGHYPYFIEKGLSGLGSVSRIPFGFHYIQLLVVALFGLITLYLADRPRTEVKVKTILLILVIGNMGVYKYLIELNGENVTSPMFSQWHTDKEIFQASEHVYESTRVLAVPETALSEKRSRGVLSDHVRVLDSELSEQINMWRTPVSNAFALGNFKIDLCIPIDRVDMISSSLYELFIYRLNHMRPGVLSNDHYVKLTNGRNEGFDILRSDGVLLDALGCGTQKMYLAHAPRFIDFNDEPDGDGIFETYDLYESPVIRTDCGAECKVYDHLISTAVTTDSIEVKYFSANKIIIEVNVPDTLPTFFIFLDSWHPGWKAKINGEPAPILRANHAFKALRLTPGTQELEFEFTGASLWSRLTIWWNFILISCGSLILLFLWLRSARFRIEKNSGLRDDF
jgi:hypothetical protein